MVRASPVLSGVLQTRTEKVPVFARYASQNSLWVEMDGHSIDSVIANLVLRLGEQEMDLGVCRLLNERQEGSGRRLVSLGKDFDFEKLFFGEDASSIHSGFRQFTADLTRDMNLYCSALDRADVDAGPKTPEDLLAHAITTVGPRLQAYLDGRLREIPRVTSAFGAEEHRQHARFLRSQMWGLLMRAPMMARTILKPRRSVSDALLLRMIYQDSWDGESTFGKLLHKYAVNLPAARAIRARLRAASRLLQALSAAHPANVLVVGCSSVVEIVDALKSSPAPLSFTLLDQEEESLLTAAWIIGEVRRLSKLKAGVAYIRESFASLATHGSVQRLSGRFDLVYSKVLLDHVSAAQAAAMARNLLDLVKPGGRLVLWALRDNPSQALAREYLLDWTIASHDLAALGALTRGLSGAGISMEDDESGIQTMLSIEKSAA